MKKRKGFVSNSSSSSFLVVGVSDAHIITQLEELTGKKRYQSDYGCESYDNIKFCSGEYIGENEQYEDFAVIGLDCEEDLNNGKTVKEIATQFQKIIEEKFNILISLDKIKIQHGQSSSD